MNHFIANVRWLYEQRGLTQREFAIKIDFHYVTVCKALTDDASPSVGFQSACARYFKQPLWKLLKPKIWLEESS